MLLWLRGRPAAAAPIQPLAWEHPYGIGAAIKTKKKIHPTVIVYGVLPISPLDYNVSCVYRCLEGRVGLSLCASQGVGQVTAALFLRLCFQIIMNTVVSVL